MQTPQLERASASLGREIQDLETELAKLSSRRDKLQEKPDFPDSDPAAIALKVIETVRSNAPALRSVEAAIETLEHRLTARRQDFVVAQKAEQSADLTQQLAALHNEASQHCEKINQLSNLLRSEIRELRRIEALVEPVRRAIQSYQPNPWLQVTQPSVPNAGINTVGCWVHPQPLD
jgi:chromosome segregation ATPase